MFVYLPTAVSQIETVEHVIDEQPVKLYPLVSCASCEVASLWLFAGNLAIHNVHSQLVLVQ